LEKNVESILENEIKIMAKPIKSIKPLSGKQADAFAKAMMIKEAIASCELDRNCTQVGDMVTIEPKEKIDCVWVWETKEDEEQAKRLEKRVKQETLNEVMKIIESWIKDYDWYDCHLKRVKKLKQKLLELEQKA